MRTLIISLVLGALIGILTGLGFGSVRSSLMAWDPANELNFGNPVPAHDHDHDSDAQETDANEESAVAETENADPNAKLPVAKTDELMFDFGIIDKNPSSEKGEHPFYIENAGEAELTLADGGKGCFCTEFTISKTKLRPGEKATVLFKWDAARSGGVFAQGIRVRTNDPKNKEITFIVKGLYTAPVIGDPSEIYFGLASASATTTRNFRILGFEKINDEMPFDLQILETEISDPEHFEVTIEKGSIDELTEEDKKNRLRSQTTNLFNGVLVMKPGMPQGSFQSILRVRTNSEQMPVLELPIRGTIKGSTVNVVGPLYSEKTDGLLKLDNVQQAVGKDTPLRIIIADKMPVNAETVSVRSVRPDWLQVELTYPDEETQQASTSRIVEANVKIPAGAPLGSLMGPGKENLGEIVFAVGVGDNVKEIVIPVRFAVRP